MLELLSEYDKEYKFNKGIYYITIDKLDEKWVDDSVRYKLIRALIESLRTLRKIRSLKILVSMRSDVIERVVQDADHAGFQREKYDDYFLNIRWNKDQLWDLVNKRVNFLYRRKYSSDNIHYNDVFDHKVGNLDSFYYILERTLMRPRDVISYLNACLGLAEGRTKISQTIIRQAEPAYSQIRCQALEQEWKSAFPTLPHIFNAIRKRGDGFSIDNFYDPSFIDDICFKSNTKDQNPQNPIQKLIRVYTSNGQDIDLETIGREIISLLYRIGVIGIKIDATRPYFYSHKDMTIIENTKILSTNKIRFHKMVHSGLGIR